MYWIGCSYNVHAFRMHRQQDGNSDHSIEDISWKEQMTSERSGFEMVIMYATAVLCTFAMESPLYKAWNVDFTKRTESIQ